MKTIMLRIILSFFSALVLISQTSYADCKTECTERSSECNQECPMDTTAGPACHLVCHLAATSCRTTCTKDNKDKNNDFTKEFPSDNFENNPFLKDKPPEYCSRVQTDCMPPGIIFKQKQAPDIKTDPIPLTDIDLFKKQK